MAQSAAPADLIVESIDHHPGCCLNDLVTFCPELTWNQIFFEVDRLSRSGFLKLALAEHGRYTIVIPTEGKFCAPQSEDAPVHPSVPTRPRQDTQCERCGGLMVSEDDDDFNGWRCILCGERIDPVILAQRRKSESACLQIVHADAECSRRLKEERAHAHCPVGISPARSRSCDIWP